MLSIFGRVAYFAILRKTSYDLPEPSRKELGTNSLKCSHPGLPEFDLDEFQGFVSSYYWYCGSFVTDGQSFTVAKGFSPLRKGTFTTLTLLGNMISSLDTDTFKVKALLEISAILPATTLINNSK